MIARRSIQAEKVAIEHIDREITISPKAKKGEGGKYGLRGDNRVDGDDEVEEGNKEKRKDFSQEVDEKEEEKRGKKNMLERLKDIVEVRRKGSE